MSESTRGDATDSGAAAKAPRCEWVFQIEAAIGELEVVGQSKYGQRQRIPITGGMVSGPRLAGEVLPGGADWQLVRPDGVLELEARYLVRAGDGALLQVRNRGILAAGGERPPYLRTVVEFEAPSDGPHAWLNRSVFVASVAVERPGSVCVRVYEVV